MYQRKDGRWQEKLTIDGKRRTFTAPSKKELKLKMAQYQTKRTVSVPFSEILDSWEKEHFAQIEEGTRGCYRPALKRAHSEFGRLSAKEITAQQIDLSMRHMAAEGYAYQTVKVYLSVLRQAFDFAVLQGEVQVNPADVVHVPKKLPRGQRVLPEDEAIRKVIEHVDDEFGLFAYFLLYTGLRRGEALALQWKDIDMEQKTIRVSKSVHFDGNRPQIKSTKTEAGQREVILLDVLARQLRPGRPTEYVFGGEKPLTLKMFQAKYKRYALNAGLARVEERKDTRTRRGKQENYTRRVTVYEITPHQLRHAFATVLYEAGVADKDAQTLLGHSKISVTRDVYTHIRKSRMEETASMLNAKIDPESGSVKRP